MRSGFADRDNHPFADDFAFHFFAHLPDLDGDHHGFDGIAELFERLGENGFRQVHHSLTLRGDELLVTFVTNTLGFDGGTIDVDAVVVRRVFDGQMHEAWDIWAGQAPTTSGLPGRSAAGRSTWSR